MGFRGRLVGDLIAHRAESHHDPCRWCFDFRITHPVIGCSTELSPILRGHPAARSVFPVQISYGSPSSIAFRASDTAINRRNRSAAS
jgi:hypothetical protein